MSIRESPLLPLHQRGGAKLVEFAGWRLPLQFTSVAEEVTACRQAAALFDISHMGLVRLSGANARAAASRLLTRDLTGAAGRGFPVGCAAYALLLNERGGILDDLFVMVESDTQVLLIVNAANHDKDVTWISQHLPCPQGLAIRDARGATFGIALQGPRAEPILRAAAPGEEPPQLFAMFRQMEIAGVPALVSRTGYTGEDGFELFGEREGATAVWRALATPPGWSAGAGPTAAGLAARDVLRQEMGYPLWGNDLDEQITPLEAGLGWAVDWDHEFIGRAAAAASDPGRRRIGFVVEGPGVARPGNVIRWAGAAVGVVTSGTYSHNLGAAIGQGYVAASPELTTGASIEIESRGRLLPARLANLPLTPARTRPSWRKGERLPASHS